MKKQLFLRSLLGIPLGITMGYIITIIISLGWGNGQFVPCVPELAEQMGSEIAAVILQTVLSAVIGGVFAGASVIWEIESWSIAKQTGIYFLVISVTMLPIAFFTRWMEHTISGFLLYFGIFVFIFIVMWVVQYMIWKKQVKKMNDKLKK